MQKRKFDELISHFNRKVSDMSIDQKYKMELLGMISAIGFAHEKELGTNLAEVGTDCISRQAANVAICNACGKIDCDKMDKCEKLQLPPANCSESPNTSDCISREQAIDIERNATVDTNPSHFEAHQKFTQFMDDAEISSFGRWQWSNGFNTALTAVGIDLKKLPSAQPKWMKAKWKPVEVDSDDNVWLWECENCHEETEFKWDFCPVCGCEMTNATKVNG